MTMRNVNFSEMDKGFEHAKLFADFVEMDDHQNNMTASNVRTIFFRREIATWTGHLRSHRAMKNPFEAKFWGDVKINTTDNEKMRTEELRYFFNRKELFTQNPVTIWKENAIITGKGLRYNTQTKEAHISQQVKIRIWQENASESENIETKIENPVASIPVAPPLHKLLKESKIATATKKIASPTQINKESN
eukprot:Anaeramoba_ignava/a218003_25.p3 GENE.a218003_25~~a218003_25.p3  ORF type:complete len:192 (+),score=21.69 a218003_25:1166-1741(+)